MSITISLPPETETVLRQRAAQAGQSVQQYVQELVEEALRANGLQSTPPNPPQAAPAAADMKTLREILAPIHEDFRRSGMTEEELLKGLEGLTPPEEQPDDEE